MNLPLNIDLQQILLHLLNFTILFAVFYLLLYKPVKKFMDDRTEYYKNLDNEANQKLLDGENAKQEYLQKLDSAEEEIDKKREAAHKEADALTEQMVAEAKKEAKAIIEKAKKEALRERNKIINTASDEITEMVEKATSKVVFSSTKEAYDSFLETVERSEENAK